MIAILDVTEKNDLMITCKSGITIRMAVADIREAGRATQGVRLIRMDDSDEIAAVARLDEQEEEEALNAETTEEGTVEGTSGETPETETPETDSEA